MDEMTFAWGFIVGLSAVFGVSKVLYDEGYRKGRKDQSEEEHLQDNDVK